MSFLLVGVGGGIGALCRLLVSAGFIRIMGKKFPVGTLFVNVLGSFLLGYFMRSNMGEANLLLFGTGMMGGFTTFSTYNYESASMLKNKDYKYFALYLILTYGLTILAGAAGFFLGK